MILINILLFLFHPGTPSPDSYPVPAKSPAHLFYIQRSLNKNTVIYEANFDDQGMLNEGQPIKVYWILYEKEGVVEELSYLERKFAYGVSHEAVQNKTGHYHIQLASYKSLKLLLKQTAPYTVELLFTNKTISSKLDHIYVQANNAGLYTKVDQLDVYTHNADRNSLDKISISPE